MTRPVTVVTASSIRRSEIAHDVGAHPPFRLSKPGDRGLHVRRLQQALIRLGQSSVDPSGTFGAATRKAVATFQRAEGLEVTGSYDARTRQALRNVLEERLPKEGPRLTRDVRGEAVRTLEQKLKRRGLLDGPVDDRFDARTSAAVRKLQARAGLKVDGVVGARVWRALGGAGEGSGWTLRRGSEGPAVTQLQQRLVQLGHLEKGDVKERFDATTERAVRSFQRARRLPRDGRVDRDLWRSLRVHQLVKDSYGGPELRRGQRGAAVRLLERGLSRLGLLKGKVGHVYDAQTEAAVRRLERRRGWKADGVAGNGVWRVLGGAGAGSGPRLEQGSGNTAAVKVLQQRLAALGHYPARIDGDFGPVTAAGVNALKRKYGLEPDGKVGRSVWNILERHVVGNPGRARADAPQRPGATRPRPGADKPGAGGSSGSEPAHNYRRVREDSGWINVRTQQMLRQAEAFARKMGVSRPFYVVQGSYTSRVAASAGTHDGGGAIDLRTRDRSRQDVIKMVKAMRMAGFAAWKRGYGDDSMDPHIHALAIGDRQLARGARAQVAEYFRGGDGLVGSKPDGDRGVGRPWPKWANKYR